jgi:hypothetical protein
MGGLCCVQEREKFPKETVFTQSRIKFIITQELYHRSRTQTPHKDSVIEQKEEEEEQKEEQI